MKRNDYRDEIPFFCSDCNKSFTIEGYVTGPWNDETVVPASRNTYVFCPNDRGEEHTYFNGVTLLLPTHRTDRNEP